MGSAGCSWVGGLMFVGRGLVFMGCDGLVGGGCRHAMSFVWLL